MHTSTITCKNCGNHFHGKFCNECGEKVYSQKDKSLSKIFGEAFHFITHFDGSFLVSLKTIFLQPGKMSEDYISGKRKKYFKPISFFLVIVVGYLLFPRFEGLNMHFGALLETDNYSWFTIPLARHKMISHKISEANLGVLYDSHSPLIAKAFLLALIPMCAFAFRLLFFTSKKYFFDHFILATEIMSLYLLTAFLLLPLLSLLIDKIVPGNTVFTEGSWFWKVFYTWFWVIVVIAFKRFYNQPVWAVSLKAVLFLFVFSVGIRYVYSAILYFLVMLFI